jgi:hypothetical protein
MTRTEASRRPLSHRQVRYLQRVTHLLAAAVLLAYVYAAPQLGAGFVAVVRWLIVPVVVASGMALWKWPRLRAMLRGRRG